MVAGAYRVRPFTGPLQAVVDVPGSKSVANRALVCAALADGVSRLGNVPDGDDTAAMLDCLRGLGVTVDRDGHDTIVHGSGGVLSAEPASVHARLAGTTSRFVTAVAALASAPITIDGHASLRARPMQPLHDALGQLGVTVTTVDGSQGLPVTVCGPPLPDRHVVRLRGDVSSQYITALMLIAPYLPAGLRIELTTPLVSRPYVEITAAVMAGFGHPHVAVGDDHVVVRPGRYASCDYTVEPDASSAGYPLAAAAMRGGSVTVRGLTGASLQGDARFCDVLASMGCLVHQDGDGTTVTRSGSITAVDVDMVDMSDLVPTLAVVATAAIGRTTIAGVGFIRGKESDRIGDLCAELRRAGIEATELPDGLQVMGGVATAATLATHHDHRLAMSLALLGLVAGGIEIADPDVVSKSWPGYWSMLESLR
jgi:3-phosphoshikimate 1-carboxyvinyltransferase